MRQFRTIFFRPERGQPVVCITCVRLISWLRISSVGSVFWLRFKRLLGSSTANPGDPWLSAYDGVVSCLRQLGEIEPSLALDDSQWIGFFEGGGSMCRHGEANFTQFWPALPQPWVQFWDPWWPLLRLASRGYAGPDPWKAAGHQQKQWPCGILSSQQVHTRGIFAIIVVCVFIHTDWCGFARLLGCPPQKLILCHWCVTCAILATSTISVPRRQRIASIQSNLGIDAVTYFRKITSDFRFWWE